MRLTALRLVRLLVALFPLAILPAAAADRAFSVEAPFGPETAAETLKLAPGGKAALRIELGEADAGEIQAVRKANAEQFTKRLQIGIGRKAPALAPTTSESLRWDRVEGGVAAQWEVSSAGAKALRVALKVGSLPASAELRFAGAADPGTVYGPFRPADIAASEGAYWSPVLEGERATVEVFVADGASTADVSLGIAWVSHLFVSPTDANADSLAKVGESGSCEVDLVCRSTSDTALANVGKAVARMTFSDGLGGGTSLCTGTLLATTAGAVAPYFYSAAHCISTQASASTLTTHWFYDRTGCGSGSTSSSYRQVTGGSTLLYANGSTDVLLVRLNQSPPAGAVYAGWDASAVATNTSLTGVHHPRGDWKKVSLGRSGGFSAYGGGTGDSHLITLWNSTATGVVEPGSSGSGIFTFTNSQYLLRGGLYGGPSSCTATGVDLRDYYSRFDRAYLFLSQYLNPNSSCSYTLSSTGASVGAGATSGSFTVSTSSGCGWGAISNASWLATTSSGSGSGTVTYSVAANTGAARTGTISVGGRTFTVSQQAGSGGTTSSLLTNGGFESGTSGWTQSATSGLAIISSGASNAHSGSGFAWLGGYQSGTDNLYTDVAVPAGASLVTLQYWYRIATEETVAGAWDTMQVLVQSPSTGATLATVATYSNMHATTSWTQSPLFDLSAFAGQTIRLRFVANMDSTLATSFLVDDIALLATTASSSTANYTSLWWVPTESGWGLNIAHNGNTLFGTLFTYDSAGAPLWLVMSAGRLVSGTTYTGELYRTTGPAFNAVPFTPIGPANLTQVGTMSLTFSGTNDATLTYTVNGATVVKSVRRMVFGTRVPTCTPTTASRASLTNYQDLWWKADESGWGVNIAHQDNTFFATLFTYDASGRDLWLVMSGGTLQPDGSYYGELYRSTGPAFNAVPFTPIVPERDLTTVGTMRFWFSDGENGTMTYSYLGAVVTKPITRMIFETPTSTRPACG